MYRTLMAATAAIALAAPVSAQDAITLDTIIISGGLTPIEADNYGRSVSVITADDIATRGIRTLSDALRALPGVAVAAAGNSYGEVRVRGGEGNHIRILIDGVGYSDGSGGSVILRGLAVSDIDRIEVLRGPQSTIYGSNAMSGVISITTKKAETPGLSYGGGIEVGSNRTLNSNVYIRNQFERGQISFSVDQNRTDGVDASILDGGDTEFLEGETINLTADYQLTDMLRAGVTLRHSNKRFGYDESGGVGSGPEFYLVEDPAKGTSIATLGSVWMEYGSEDDAMKHRLTFRGNEIKDSTRDSLSIFGCCSSSRGTNVALEYVGSFALDGNALSTAAHRLNVLAETRKQTYQSSYNPGGTYVRSTQSLALEYRGEVSEGLAVQLGLRHDFNDTFKDATTWNASLSYQIPGQDIRLRAALGSAVVDPTMTEQFGFFPGSYIGNPNLRPEQSRSAEIGVDFGLGDRGTLSLSAYQTRLTDLISGAGTTSVNLPGASKIKGFEAEMAYDVAPWLTLTGAYGYTDARDSSGAPLVRRPKHELRLSAVARTLDGRATFGADLRHARGSFDSEWFRGAWPAPVAELPAITTLDLSASYELTSNLQLNARIKNVTNKRYQEAWGYYANPREVFVGISANW